ncbi:hypothetical protein MTO96_007276 [Rhipicephalus appendiculatus]
MNGSHNLENSVIGRCQKSAFFKNEYIQVCCCSNMMAWVTFSLNHGHTKIESAAVLVNNCSAHTVCPKRAPIELVFLSPNATAGFLPSDPRVITNSKALHRRHVLEG